MIHTFSNQFILRLFNNRRKLKNKNMDKFKNFRFTKNNTIYVILTLATIFYEDSYKCNYFYYIITF